MGYTIVLSVVFLFLGSISLASSTDAYEKIHSLVFLLGGVFLCVLSVIFASLVVYIDFKESSLGCVL